MVIRNIVLAGLLALGLSGCSLAGVGVVSSALSAVETVTANMTKVDTTVQAGCQTYSSVETVLAPAVPLMSAKIQADVKSVETYGDAFCFGAPPANGATAAQNVTWLTGLVADLQSALKGNAVIVTAAPVSQ